MSRTNASVPARLANRLSRCLATIALLVAAACNASNGDGADQGTRPSAGHASVTLAASSSPEPIDSVCSDDTGGVRFRAVSFTTQDGVPIYGAVAGDGHVGLVLANDVPHPICEQLAPAVALVRRGYRVLFFDYRYHGRSGSAGALGRLDLDVAAAVQELRGLAADVIVLLGSYAGAAACLVAVANDRLAVQGVVGLSPTAIRGQYVGGPFDPEGPMQAAARIRIPVLYVTPEHDGFVPVAEARRLFEATSSRDKRMLVVPNGFPGWYLLEGGTLRRVIAFIEQAAS